MQKYAKLNMLKYSFLKYHNMLNLCLDMHYMPKISINMHKYAKKNVQICKKIWKYMHLPNEFTPIAYICTYMKKKCTFICKICKHEIYMHNMHLFAFLMPSPAAESVPM